MSNAVRKAIAQEKAARKEQEEAMKAQADAVASILLDNGGEPLPPRSMPPQNPRAISMPKRANPNERYIELPPAVAEFVQENVQTHDVNLSAHFSSAAEYFTRHQELLEASRQVPASVPAPLGWAAEYVDGHRSIDVVDLLSSGNDTARKPEMLTDLIRWALTVQRAQEGMNVLGALRRIEDRATESDKALGNGVISALLHKFRTLVSLSQQKAFAGKSELLTKCLLDDWEWIQAGVQYKTPIAQIASSKALYDDATMQPEAFTGAGNFSSCMDMLKLKLIDSAAAYAPLRDARYGSNDFQYLLKTAHVKAERVTFEADSPVILSIGYQEQLPGGEMFDGNGSTGGARDVAALTLTLTNSGLRIEQGDVPHDSPMRGAVMDAVSVLLALSEAGK